MNSLFRFVKSTATFFCVLSSSTTFAGNISGGGGKGVVCRKADGSINKPVELLDLWEARTIYNRQINPNSETASVQLDAALERVKHFADYRIDSTDFNGQKIESADALKLDLAGRAHLVIGNYGKSDQQNAIFKRNVKFTLTSDSLEDMTPDEAGCQIEQIVNWKDYPTGPFAEVNLDLLDHMDNANKAALGLHESLYWYLRTNGDEANSRRVRRTVGYIMSGGSFQSLKAKLNKPYIECISRPHFSKTDDLASEDDGSAIYFTNGKSQGSVTGIVDHIRNFYAIDFALTVGYPNVESMFAQIQKAGISRSIRLVTWSDLHIEPETVAYLQIAKGGRATAILQSASGGQQIAPDRDLRCSLNK